MLLDGTEWLIWKTGSLHCFDMTHIMISRTVLLWQAIFESVRLV